MKTLFLDVDGPLADFVAHMIATLRTQAGVEMTTEDITVREFTKPREHGGLLDPLASAVAERVMAQDAWWEQLPPTPMARQSVLALRADGWRIIIVTAPWLSCRGWEHRRREWLKRHFDIPARDVIPTHHKDLVHANRGVEAILDDHPRHVEAWHANTGGHALLLDFPWNRTEGGHIKPYSMAIKNRAPIRMPDWPAVVTYLKGLTDD